MWLIKQFAYAAKITNNIIEWNYYFINNIELLFFYMKWFHFVLYSWKYILYKIFHRCIERQVMISLE